MSPARRIDLHLHSRASDGVDTPAEVVRAAAEEGLQVMALTDHDTDAGWPEAAAEARRLGVALVRGVEISARVGDIGVHLLSYLHDPTDPAVRALILDAKGDRVARARSIVEALAVDHPVTWEDVVAQVGGDLSVVGRPHIADALVARGVAPDRDAVFATLLQRDSPYHRTREAPDAVAAVATVRAAGGVPVLAHPLAAARGRCLDEADFEVLVAAGLAGWEADHPHHDADQRRRARALAQRLGVLATGSSDYHGAVRPGRPGAETTDDDTLSALLAQARGLEFLT